MTAAHLKPVPVAEPDDKTRMGEFKQFVELLQAGAPMSVRSIGHKSIANNTVRGDFVKKAYKAACTNNQNGLDVYLVANRVDPALVDKKGVAARGEYIQGVNALFADFDQPELVTLDKLRALALPPSLIVETSPGKYQCYWLTDGPEAIGVDEFRAFQLRVLATLAEFCPDKSVIDPSRVMRLPGLHHIKAKVRPVTEDDPVSSRFVSRLREANGKRYSRAELVGFFGEPSKDDYRTAIKSLEPQSGKAIDAEWEEHIGEKGQQRLAHLVDACEYLIARGTDGGEAWASGNATWQTMTAAFARFVAAGELRGEAIEHWDQLCKKAGGDYEEVRDLKRLLSFADGGYGGTKITAASVFAIAEPAYWINPAKPKLVCVLHHVKQLDPQADTAEVDALINHCVKMPQFEQERVLTALKAITKTAMGTLRSMLKDAKKRSAQDTTGFSIDDHREIGNKALESIGNDNLFYSQGWWWRWQDSGVWRRVEDINVKQAVLAVIPDDLAGVTSNTVASVCELMKAKTLRANVLFDETAGSDDSVNCLNGLLVLRDDGWELEPHNKEQYRTTQIPIVYDPNATAPQFEAFLESVFRDDEDKQDKIKLVLELIGYTLMSHARYAHSIIAVGSGANGKSVLLNLVEALVGQDNVSAADPGTLDNPFNMAHLQGKLMNSVAEIGKGSVLADREFKAVVAGDTMDAQHKHKDPFKLAPFCTMWIATNHLPHVRDTTEAMERRVSILKFNRSFRGRADTKLSSKLKQELPGILNLALAAYALVVKREGFTQPSSSLNEVKQWLKEADQAASFIDECCSTSDTHATTGKGDLYRAYSGWASCNGHRLPLTKIQFGKRLNQLGYTDGHNNQKHFWRGIQLNQARDFEK